MTRPTQFSVVGSGVLAMSCTQQLLDRGLPVRAVVSNDPDVIAWAAQRGLRSARDLQVLAELESAHCHVLLSVSNNRLIPASILDRFPLAINFHDAPLPKYSGSHATSWALMAREREYAISWHLMTSRADAGHIVLRVPVPIGADETAFTLNGKCHEAALASFPRLLDAILSQSLTERPQNPVDRVFYPRERRPDRCAVLDFRRPAHELEALARALSCGEYVNRLGLPKVWAGEGMFVARRIELKAARSRGTPGTVLAVQGDVLEVSTTTHDVRLRDLACLDGEVLDAAALAQRYGVFAGTLLPTQGSALDDALAHAARCHWRDEEYWVQRLRELKPLALPTIPSATEPGEVVVKGRLCERAQLLAVTLAWLARISGTSRFDIGLADERPCGPLLAAVRPFGVAADLEITYEAFHVVVAEAYAAWLQRGPYLREAPLRYPQVVTPPGWAHFGDWPLVIGFAYELSGEAPPLHIALDPSGGCIRLRSSTRGVLAAALSELGRQLEAFVIATGEKSDVPLKSISMPGALEQGQTGSIRPG